MAVLNPINPTAVTVLKACRDLLTPQQYRTLRGQVLAGEDGAAMKGLSKILRRDRRGEVRVMRMLDGSETVDKYVVILKRGGVDPCK